ncbi:hypothetical protein Tco_0074851 [Tanacetum coccineum]
MKLEKKVKAMSKIDHTEAIDKSVQAHLKKVLPKDVPDFGKIKQEKAAKKNMPKYSTKPFDEDSLKEYDQKNKLMSLMMKSKSFKTHPAHQKLYDALMDSLLVDEDDMDKQYKPPFEPSKTNKTVNAEELVQDAEMDAKEFIEDDVVDGQELTQDDDVSEVDTSK